MAMMLFEGVAGSLMEMMNNDEPMVSSFRFVVLKSFSSSLHQTKSPAKYTFKAL